MGSSSLFLAKDADATAARGKDKAAVDSKFLQRITVILKVLVPSPLSAEFAYLVLVAAALMARTYADIYMIQVCNFWVKTAFFVSIKNGGRLASHWHNMYFYLPSFS